LTTSGDVTCAVSATTLSTPPLQNHHLTASFMAHTKLAFFLPSFSRQRLSRSSAPPRSIHPARLHALGRTSPLSTRRFHASAAARRRSKLLTSRSAITSDERCGWRVYRSDASSGRA
jgi:hypothetical protein